MHAQHAVVQRRLAALARRRASAQAEPSCAARPPDAATRRLLDNSTNGVLNQNFADGMFANYDVISNSTDPLMEYRISQPINQNDANIHGVEFAFQHFFDGYAL